MTNADKIKLMRSHAVMAGITSLSQQYPQHVPLEARSAPAALYLYDSILLAGKNNVHAAFAGLRRFVIVLLDDIDQGRTLPSRGSFFTADDYEVLASIRNKFTEGKTGKVELLLLLSQWNYPRGKSDDVFIAYNMRRDVVQVSERLIRLGIAEFIRMMADLDDAEPDWWHRLGQAISLFAMAYMAESWAALGEVVQSFEAMFPGEYYALSDSQNAMRWEYQLELFVRLGDHIGINASQLPHDRPEAKTAVLSGVQIPHLGQF